MTTVADLVSAFRSEMFDEDLGDDGNLESLWTEDDILRYIDFAQNDFARATRCFPDSRLFKPSITAGNPLVRMDSRIIKIRTGYLQSTGNQVFPVSAEDLDEGVLRDDYGITISLNWRSETGVPKCMVTDDDFGYLRLYPQPVQDDVLELSVWRLPKEQIKEGGELEIPDDYRLDLITGMKAHAFQKNDFETYDEGRATAYKLAWQKILDERSTHFKVKRRKRRVVRYGGL